MPVDEPSNASLTLQVSSSSSAGLSVDAREFVPKTKNRDGLGNGASASASSKKKKYTGAIAKRPLKSASQAQLSEQRGDQDREYHRHQQLAPRFKNKSLDNVNGERNRDSGRDRSSSDNLKFYKDNQNHYNKASTRDGYYNNQSSQYQDRRRFEGRRRYEYDERDEYQRKPVKEPSAYKKSSGQRSQKKEKSIEPSKISQREQLIKDIESNSLECMICCDKIKDHQPVWNCSNCFHIIHLNCIKTWISNSKTDSGEWRCVACQYLRLEPPSGYYCFCGKQKYPAVNRNDLAHSCGEMCGRTDTCVHPCTLKCHPGLSCTLKELLSLIDKSLCFRSSCRMSVLCAAFLCLRKNIKNLSMQHEGEF